MDSSIVIIMSIVGFIALVATVWDVFNTKSLHEYSEYKIVVIGALSFMYISWLVIYMANINPFVEPVFKSHFKE
ncbi:V-type H+-transporting ATPase subunit e [Pancytospora epiphaga]|nr:V-type H+-transporting ATPase subunit e [Pancytospora epiphaga]